MGPFVEIAVRSGEVVAVQDVDPPVRRERALDEPSHRVAIRHVGRARLGAAAAGPYAPPGLPRPAGPPRPRPPPARMPATVSADRSAEMSATITNAPSRAIFRAPARPIPEPDAVTMATRLSKIMPSLPLSAPADPLATTFRQA